MKLHQWAINFRNAQVAQVNRLYSLIQNSVSAPTISEQQVNRIEEEEEKKSGRKEKKERKEKERERKNKRKSNSSIYKYNSGNALPAVRTPISSS